MVILVGASNNIFTSTLNIAAKTLTISGLVGCDLNVSSLRSVYSVTQSVSFQRNTIATCVFTPVGGLPTWVYTFTSIPANVANGDTLYILLEVPDTVAIYSVLLKIAGATV